MRNLNTMKNILKVKELEDEVRNNKELAEQYLENGTYEEYQNAVAKLEASKKKLKNKTNSL